MTEKIPQYPAGTEEQREKPKLELWVVDDDTGIGRNLCEVIEDVGHYATSYFRTAATAIEELTRRVAHSEELPHGVIMDGNLSYEDPEELRKGASVIARMRAVTNQNERTILFIANSGTDEDNEAMQNAGAALTLGKANIDKINSVLQSIEKHYER